MDFSQLGFGIFILGLIGGLIGVMTDSQIITMYTCRLVAVSVIIITLSKVIDHHITSYFEMKLQLQQAHTQCATEYDE